ncbi:MAG TPA: cytochrome P450 [Euzebyales bacterium]|nr:cytochrome P450 [Euzebyales bacterium]
MSAIDPREATVAHVVGLAEHSLTAAKVNDVDVVLVRNGDSVAAFEGRCPHRGTLLAEGTIDGDQIVCAGHGWRFDARTGVNADPSRACLRPLTTRIVDGHVLVDTADLAAVATQTTPMAARNLDDLPGPRGLPLLGNLLQLDLKRLHAVFEAWRHDYGDVYRVGLAGRPAVAISAPDLMRDVLRRRPDDFRRIGTIEPVLSELGVMGVFAAEGDVWRRHRRLVTRALDARHLRRFLPMLMGITRRLHRRWSTAAEAGAVVDMPRDMMRFTVDVTTSLVFGHDINTIEGHGDEIRRHLELVFPMINRRINMPFAYWRKVKLPSDRRLDAALAQVHAYCFALIDETRQRLAADPGLAARPGNLLEAMVAATTDEGERLTGEELLGNMLTMLLAGEDTTANTLAWTVYLMSRSPDVRDALRTEIDAAAMDQPATYVEQGGLPCTDAVVAEAMRLKPVAPLLFFEANHDVVLGDIRLPGGTGVVLPTRLPGIDASVIESPDSFRPERWLMPRPPGSDWRADVMPFGGGPRFCPGRNLALIEARMVTAMLYRHFDVELVTDPDAVGERFSFTMAPTDLRVRLRVRDAGRVPEHVAPR